MRAVIPEGTQVYASLEAFCAHSAQRSMQRTRQQDAWSVGMTMLQLCYGFTPWSDEDEYLDAVRNRSFMLVRACLAF